MAQFLRRLFSFLGACALVSHSAFSQTPTTAIRYQCNEEHQSLIVDYFGEWLEEHSWFLGDGEGNLWFPDGSTFVNARSAIDTTNTIIRRCNLEGIDYRIELRLSTQDVDNEQGRTHPALQINRGDMHVANVLFASKERIIVRAILELARASKSATHWPDGPTPPEVDVRTIGPAQLQLRTESRKPEEFPQDLMFYFEPMENVNLRAHRAGGMRSLWEYAISKNDAWSIGVLSKEAQVSGTWNDALVITVAQGRLDLLSQFLTSGASLNERPYTMGAGCSAGIPRRVNQLLCGAQLTALELAVCVDSTELVEFLLSRGARPNAGAGGVNGDAVTNAIVCGAHESLEKMLIAGARLSRERLQIERIFGHTKDASLAESMRILIRLGLNPDETRPVLTIPSYRNDRGELVITYGGDTQPWIEQEKSLLELARAYGKPVTAGVLAAGGRR